MKKTALMLSFFCLGTVVFGQMEKQIVKSTNTVSKVGLFQSRKPADGYPAVFANQAELDAKKADKIDKTKQKLMENKENPEMVKFLQEELWRFENAIAKEIKN
jgi:hypothetical protein